MVPGTSCYSSYSSQRGRKTIGERRDPGKRDKALKIMLPPAVADELQLQRD
jgi:hypothetical protein